MRLHRCHGILLLRPGRHDEEHLRGECAFLLTRHLSRLLSDLDVASSQVFPVSSSGAPVSEFPFTRTGLLGFIGPGGLIFSAGKMDGLMVVGGRRHNADDIVATALAVEPMKFVYRGRLVFSASLKLYWFSIFGQD